MKHGVAITSGGMVKVFTKVAATNGTTSAWLHAWAAHGSTLLCLQRFMTGNRTEMFASANVRITSSVWTLARLST